jgi:multidrug efflux pump subunit AcrA (membrane-fusion protein)
MKENKNVIITLFLAIVILVSVYFLTKNTDSTVTAEETTKNTIDAYIVKAQANQIEELNSKSYRSRVNDTNFIEFVAGKEGLIQTVNVSVGDKVYAGQTLVTLYHPQSQEAAAGLAIEAKKAEIDAQIIKDASINLKNFNEKYNDKLKATIQTSQNSINNSVDNFVSNSLNSSTSTSSYIFNINKTLEQDIREIQAKISYNKNSGSKIDSNMLAKGGISALDSQYFYQYSSILANTKYDGNAIEAYQNASQFYSATLKLLNVSVPSENGLSQTELNSLKGEIIDRISDMASNYQDINSVILDSIKTKYEVEVAKANTNLDLQKTLLSAEKEIEQNNLEVKKLEAQANLYPEIYKSGLGNILYTTFTAPFDGIVSDLPKVKGNLVSVGDIVVSVSGESGKRSAIIQIDKDTELKQGESLFVYDPIKPFQKWEAKVKGVGLSVNSKGLKLVQLEIPKEAKFVANQSIRARFKGHTHLEIPLSAVSSHDNKTFVWKITDGTITKVPVVLGEIVNNTVLVEEGLLEGDTIATVSRENYLEGQSVEADIIKESATTTESGDGHAHEH